MGNGRLELLLALEKNSYTEGTQTHAHTYGHTHTHTHTTQVHAVPESYSCMFKATLKYKLRPRTTCVARKALLSGTLNGTALLLHCSQGTRIGTLLWH